MAPSHVDFTLRGLSLTLISLTLLLPLAAANVEKTIFLGPPSINVPLARPSLPDLRLDVLSPATPATSSLRTHLTARFPDAESPGKATWLLLDGLNTDQRYEVRVCWAATQPTAFSLETYELPVVWETPRLIASLNEYALSRQPAANGDGGDDDAPRPRIASEPWVAGEEREASMLFLRIVAAADYFTTNATLMRHVSPVHVDIILDPFLLNVLPRSLAPTAAYIAIVAVVSYFVARRVVSWIQSVVTPAAAEEKKQQ